MPKITVIDVLHHLRYEYRLIQNDPKDFGTIAYHVGLSMEEIARGFIHIGAINAHDKFMSVFYATEAFSRDKAAVDSGFRDLQRGLGSHRLRLFLTAGAMELAGYSCSFMMSRMRNCARVGWREATIIMLVAGYRADRVKGQLWVSYRSSLIRDILISAALKATVARMLFQWAPYISSVKLLVRIGKWTL